MGDQPKQSSHMNLLLALICLGSSTPAHAARPPAPEVLRLWPGQAPGTPNWTGPEEEVDAELPNLGKVHIITNVIVPTLTVVRPPSSRASGTAMVVVPGGAFRALPWDLDGTETAKWLAARGITVFLLKYRVRPPQKAAQSGPETFEAFAVRTTPERNIAVADAKRALAIVRSSAKRYGIAPGKVGMIGFSAGAMTVMSVAVGNNAADRPDFAVSLYGALLEPGEPPVGGPPLFVVAAQDDGQAPPLRSIDMVERWTKSGLPAELHLYQRGGHGFAFRRHCLPADRWAAAFEVWLADHGYIDSERHPTYPR
jgi:acetyl esterase/lipase